MTLAAATDFEAFRHRLEKALKRSDGSKGGRPPYDPVLMFKVLVLQALYNLSDDQAEFQIPDRLSFLRFLGLAPMRRAPMPRRSGCSGSIWCKPGRSTSSSRCSMRG